MNFNYDLATWIDYFIGAFICCYGMVLCGSIFLNIKIKQINLLKYLLIFVFSIILIFNTLMFDNIGKMFISLIIFVSVYKFIYKENIVNSLLYGICTYICYIISEVTISSIIALFDLLFRDIRLEDFVKSIFMNLAIAITALLYAFLLKKRVNELIKRINVYSILHIFILGIITIIGMATSLFRLASNNFKVDYVLILNIISFLGFLIITIVLLKQYLINKDINDKYRLLKDYLKTSADLIEKYSSAIHKYKNNLIAIKGYLKLDENKANSYIDDLLEAYDFKKYSWFNKINHINIDVLRYLIYYKLSKAENNNLKIYVDVSKDLNEYNNEVISIKESNVLLDILGELFDNAIYASNESKEKEINFIVYEEKNNIIIILSNTYCNNIELSLITKNGYTTKGEGHGLGLYDIDKTIKNNDMFIVRYELLDKYFIATLTIDLNKKNKI